MKDGLVRRIKTGADRDAVVELVVVRHLLRFLSPDDVRMAWSAIQADLWSHPTFPERLDLIWFQDPAQARLSASDGELATLIRSRPRKVQVVPLGELLAEVADSWRTYISSEWKGLAARQETERLGPQKRGRKAKGARIVQPGP